VAGAGLLSLNVPYKIFPIRKPVPGYPKEAKETWVPMLPVSIIVGHTTSKRFEAVVDSGSGICLFHADIGKAIGLKLKDGELSTLGGVIGGSKGDVWYHKIKLKVAGDIISITAGFCENLAAAAILGRHGFFEHFIVTFDPSTNPPGLRVERLHRA
jgi:hypothetical protein